MDKVSFPYGKQAFDLDPSHLGGCQIFSPVNFEPDETEEDIIKRALANPAASPPLPVLLEEKTHSRITVVLSDITRVTGSHVFLPMLQGIFEAGRVRAENIS